MRVSAEVGCRIRSEDLAEGELTLLSDWLITEERFGNVTQSLLVNRTFSELELHYYDVAAASHPGEPLTFCAADDTCPTCPKKFTPEEGKSVLFMMSSLDRTKTRLQQRNFVPPKLAAATVLAS